MARYKSTTMERCYTEALRLAAQPDSELYRDGKPRRGAGHRCAFWDGFDGVARSAHVVPNTMSAAFFAAGKEWARQQRRSPAAQRKQAERERRRDAGEVLVQEWMHKDDAETLRTLAADLRVRREASSND